MAVVRMTEGNIRHHLLRYSIPLILGNLFQLTYNVVDSVIVGRFIGKEALAAVGTAAPMTSLIILGISGICMGASVLMSEFFGAGEEELVKKELATTLVFGFLFSVLVIALGILFTEPMLQLLSVPKEIMEMTTIYLRIIFMGACFTYLYNAMSSALKSVGDSKTPLRFLIFASVLNGVLDVILIGFLGFGIVCSAVTTVVAEGVSAILCILYVYRNIPQLQLGIKDLRMEKQLLKKTLRYGGVTALQQSCQPIGKILIQGAINSMGVDAMAVFQAVSRIDDYAFTPEQSISHGITTFVAQNRGAGNHERVRKGFRTGLMLEGVYWMMLCVVILTTKEWLIRLFVRKEQRKIIELGSSYLLCMAFFYLLPAFTNGIQGFFRGMGKMKVTLIGTFIQTSLRVVFVYVLSPVMGISGVAFACAIGWSVMLLAEVPYYFYYMRSQSCKE